MNEVCCMCYGKSFLPGERKMVGYWDCKAYKFITPVMICIECGHYFVSRHQTPEFRKRLIKAKDKNQRMI